MGTLLILLPPPPPALLPQVWHRFRYVGTTFATQNAKQILEHNRIDGGGTLAFLEGRQYAGTDTDDAFATIMQWLFHRIPHTRGGNTVRAWPAADTLTGGDMVRAWPAADVLIVVIVIIVQSCSGKNPRTL